MKRFLIIVAALFTMFAAQAQTIESSKILDNTYVTVLGGGITTYHTGPVASNYAINYGGKPFFWGGAGDVVKSARPVAGIELGKYVTPVVGFSVEALAMFNTTGSNTFVDQSNIVGNLKFNLSNLFGGYPGQPRRVEVVLVPGLGWGHDYGKNYVDRNYLTYNAAAELNVNLGKTRAFQINIKPAVVWNNYNNAVRPLKRNMEGRVLVGLTYKFGSKSKKSHNFVVCPYSVTKSDYDALQSRYDAIAAEKAKVDTVQVVKVVPKEVYVKKRVIVPGTAIITFPIGSSYLYDVEKVKIAEFVKTVPEGTPIIVLGSADTKTGNARINERLATNRANVVADYLRSLGVSTDRITTTTKLDAFENAAASRAAVISVGD